MLTLNKKYSDRWQLQANWVISEDRSNDDNERDPFTIRYADYLDLELRVQPVRPPQPAPRQRLRLVGSAGRRAGLGARAVPIAQPTTGTDLVGQDVNNDNHANDRRFVNGMDVGRNKQEKDNRFFTIDLRISKVFPSGAGRSLEAMFEVFNLTNSENNIVSQISGGLLFDFSGTIRSGVGDPRQAQIGVRIGSEVAVRLLELSCLPRVQSPKPKPTIRSERLTRPRWRDGSEPAQDGKIRRKAGLQPRQPQTP